VTAALFEQQQCNYEQSFDQVSGAYFSTNCLATLVTLNSVEP